MKFELPEDTKRKMDLAGKVLKLKRSIDKRETAPGKLTSDTEDLKRRYEILKRRLDIW